MFAPMFTAVGSVLNLMCAQNGQLLFTSVMQVHMRPCGVDEESLGTHGSLFTSGGLISGSVLMDASLALHFLGYCKLPNSFT